MINQRKSKNAKKSEKRGEKIVARDFIYGHSRNRVHGKCVYMIHVKEHAYLPDMYVWKIYAGKSIDVEFTLVASSSYSRDNKNLKSKSAATREAALFLQHEPEVIFNIKGLEQFVSDPNKLLNGNWFDFISGVKRV